MATNTEKRMKSIKEKSKEWCGEHSNKGCKEKCNGCWQVKQPWGCEQYNMELAYETGANYVVEEIENLVKTTIGEGETYHYNLYIGLVNLLEQLKK